MLGEVARNNLQYINNVVAMVLFATTCLVLYFRYYFMGLTR